MADFVFVYDGEKYPNIHGHENNYGSEYVITPRKSPTSFGNIKTRYLNMMKSQLKKNIANTGGDTAFLEGLTASEFGEKYEEAIEKAIVEKYNKAVSESNFGEGIYYDAFNKIYQNSMEQNQDEIIRAFDQLITLFKKGASTQQIIDNINNNQASPIEITLDDILGIQTFKKNIEQHIMTYDKSGESFKSQVTNSLAGAITKTSEAFAIYAAMPQLVEGATDDAIMDVLSSIQKRMVGVKPDTVSTNFTQSGTVESKAADALIYPNLTISRIQEHTKKKLNINGELVVSNYASIKTPITPSETGVGMISYSGSNSITMGLLRKIYGDSKKTNYQLYNTLAFHKKDNSVLGQNFKVIRHDMITEAAEKYIAGFSEQFAQRVLIYRFTAYPMLSIIAAIAQEAAKLEEGQAYGSNNIFTINFDFKNVDNRYRVGEGEGNSNLLKRNRIRDVKRAIDGIQSRGKFSVYNFKRLIKQYASKDIGIPLKGIIPLDKSTKK